MGYYSGRGAKHSWRRPRNRPRPQALPPPVPLSILSVPKTLKSLYHDKRSKKEGTHKRPKTGQAPKLRGNEAVVGVEVVVINNTKARARARAKVVVVVAVEGCLPHIVLVAVDVATTRVVGHGVL